MQLRLLPIPPGAAAREALPVLREALAGGFAVLPYASDGQPPPTPAGAAPDTDTALVVATSGSTGSPKLAMLPGTALTASAAATHERLGGPGTWLLAMPPHHIAGVQVLLRCLAAGTDPEFVDLRQGFSPEALALSATRMPGDRRYTALVPTQLARALSSPAAVESLAALDAVLVGGAATPPRLLAEARERGIRAVTTYGMSETAGGCVYDGVPLRDTRVRRDPEGRLHLGGATLSSGYLGLRRQTEAAFSADSDGSRWFRTDDTGHVDGAGRWHVDGRLDDLVNTGGLKVAPRLVEEALTQLDQVTEAVVVGTPDAEWGEVVSAALVLRPGVDGPTVEQLRRELRGILPDHALPRRVVTVDALPLRGPGKPDRVAIRSLFPSSGVTP